MIFDRFSCGLTVLSTGLLVSFLAGQGPVVHFTFDDRKSPTVDVVGGHRAQLRNGATFATDRAPIPGNVASLDLTKQAGALAQIAHAAVFNFGRTQPMSYTMWLKPLSRRGHFLGKRVGCSRRANIHYQGVIQSSNMGLSSCSGGCHNGHVVRPFPVNRWTHVGFTFDGRTMRVYWDGAEVASVPGFQFLVPNTADLLLGNSGSCGPSGSFPGWMDDFRLYLRALEPCEVKAMVRGSTGTFTAFGKSCPGTNNKLPQHRGVDAPTIGLRVAWELSDARPLAPAIFFLGSQATNLALDQQGLRGCSLYTLPLVVLGLPTDASGGAVLSVPLGCDPKLVGVRVQTQFVVWDIAAPHRWPLALTGGLTTVVGRPR